MRPLILATVARVMAPALILFSLVMVVRGHQAPGGGFVGGLLAAAAFVLFSVGHGRERVWSWFRLPPRRIAGWGLGVALGSGAVGLLTGGTFLQGRWAHWTWGGAKVELGTPLLFDLGVYLLVFGVTLSVFFEAERA